MTYYRLGLLAVLFNFFIFDLNYANSSSKYDKNLPIEITANSLEVLQNDKIAIFKGNVDAKQGKITLKADKLKVHYLSNLSSDNQSVSKILADGNVLFSTELETAKSDKGLYDVDRSLITLSGRVTLTQGENILRGNELTIDLKTGKNTMKGDDKSLGQTTKDGRVKGLFVPNKRK